MVGTIISGIRTVPVYVWLILILVLAVFTVALAVRLVRQKKRLSALAEHTEEYLTGQAKPLAFSLREDAVAPLEIAIAEMENRIEKEREHSRQEARRTSDLTADISHQLKTPLASLRLFAEMDASAHMPQEISQIERMETLISSLLRLEKMCADGYEFTFAEHDLRSLAEETWSQLRPLWPEKRVTIQGEAAARCDEKWLSEAFLNLLKNACEHTARNGNIKVRLEQTDRTVFCTVEDDGSGEYTFDQAGYHESYPFTISRDGNRFSVDIPATSQLGSVEGTWELKNEILVLDITSTFTRGGSYSYIAECKKAAAKETDIKETDSRQGIAAEYNWLTYRLTVDSAEIVPGTELDKSPFSTIKDKSFAKIRLLGKNGSIQLTDLQEDSQLEQFVLTNKDGKELPLYSVSMWGVGFDAEKGTFSTFEKQEGFDLIFLLDGSEAVEDLTLTVRN